MTFLPILGKELQEINWSLESFQGGLQRQVSKLMRVLLLPGKSSALQQRLGCPLVSFPHSILDAGVLTAEVFTFSDSSSPFSPCTLLPLLQAFMCCKGRAHLAEQCFVWDGQTLWWTLPLNAGLKDNPYPFLCSPSSLSWKSHKSGVDCRWKRQGNGKKSVSESSFLLVTLIAWNEKGSVYVLSS